MNHVKICKGQPSRFALSKLVQALYKTFPFGYFGQVQSTNQQCAEIKPVLHNLVQRIRSWRVTSLEQHFEYLY